MCLFGGSGYPPSGLPGNKDMTICVSISCISTILIDSCQPSRIWDHIFSIEMSDGSFKNIASANLLFTVESVSSHN